MDEVNNNNNPKENKKETKTGEPAKKTAALNKERKLLAKRDPNKAPVVKKEKEKVNRFDELKRYLRGVVNELKKVHWLGTREIVIYTIVVLVAVLFVGSLIWLFDSLLTMVLRLVM